MNISISKVYPTSIGPDVANINKGSNNRRKTALKKYRIYIKKSIKLYSCLKKNALKTTERVLS